MRFIFGYAIAHFIIRNSSARLSWGPKYLSYALALDLKGRDLEALSEIWEHCLKCEAAQDDLDQWFAFDDLNSCVKSILSTGKSLNDFLSPSHLTANDFPTYLMR